MRRNLHLAHIRMWAGDYTLSGLVGFELKSKTVGVLGTGAIGAAACRIFRVMPCLSSQTAQKMDTRVVRRLPHVQGDALPSNSHCPETEYEINYEGHTEIRW